MKEFEQLLSIVRERLLTTPVELQERNYYIEKIVQREKKLLKIKEKLQAEYDLQMKIKMAEVYRENATAFLKWLLTLLLFTAQFTVHCSNIKGVKKSVTITLRRKIVCQLTKKSQGFKIQITTT